MVLLIADGASIRRKARRSIQAMQCIVDSDPRRMMSVQPGRTGQESRQML